MESAHSLDGHDRTGDQGEGGERDGIGGGDEGALGGEEIHVGAAGGASVGLGVEAAVQRVPVLALAGRAHGEGGHGGLGPVVGDAVCDGEAGAAARAIGERVVVAPVGLVQDLAQAVFAGGEVGRDGDAPLGRSAALFDHELRRGLLGDGVTAKLLHPGQRRGVHRKAALEVIEGRRSAEGLDGHARSVVADSAR